MITLHEFNRYRERVVSGGPVSAAIRRARRDLDRDRCKGPDLRVNIEHITRLVRATTTASVTLTVKSAGSPGTYEVESPSFEHAMVWSVRNVRPVSVWETVDEIEALMQMTRA